ncbi:beta strand repeat-containing protein [Chryseobacterium cheonjiense]|uniref:DUF8202 domain-containing protein n=1 Tax=Chryseobacterium cheonjiense TaxID=2728845 RepID=A0A7Y0A9Y3_9FLAO|nr:hypothetical protein [Chryseobacterium cheonjiense]NML59384.1 hypothetical protein [Chryseobacterium cheonjiense]
MKKILLIIYCLLFIVWTQAQSPGGVSSNLAGWYSADVSANATTWTDRSPAGNNLTGAGTPTFTNLLNFNRVATFNGSSQRFSLATTSASWPGTNTANTYYYVATPTGANASRSVFGKGTGTTATNGLHSGKGSTATTLVSGATPAGTVSKTLVWAQNVPEMIRTGFNGGTTGAHYISDNGTAETSAGSSNPSYAANSAFAIGSQNTAAGFWDGDVAEVIAYSGKHTAADFNRVESYLAMKYGITKASNYVNSAGTTIWTSGGGYDNNIAGIGRDDMGGSANNGLNQKQSQSQNSGLQPVIGNVNITDTNANNTNTFSTDLSALVLGSDTGSTSFATSFVFGGLNNRMARIWRVQETGTVGTVKVALPANQITANLSSLSLVVSVDATFDGSDTRTAMTLETLGGIQYYTATVDFTSGQFFTFASLVTAPGGVISGLNIWFDASTGTFSDNGITPSVNNGKVAQWNNRTNNPNFLSVNQSNATRQPDYKTGYVNFNPAIEFFGSSTANQESLIRNGLVSDLFTSNANSSFMLWRAATGVLSTTNYTNTANRYDFYASNTGQFGGNFISTTGTLSTWNITSFVINSTANLGSVNGGSPYSSISRSVDLNTAVTADFALGGRPDGQFFDTSYIPEFINYTRVLTNSELNRVNSYLSLKYGTTLGTASNLVNYTSSDGSTIFWTGNATYQNNIAGIVRDDASALNQKQSQSVNSGLQPVIGNVNITDTNANNTNTFSTDLSALVWGSDTGSTSFATSFVFGGLNNRMARIWRVQETGTVGTVKIALPTSQILGNLSSLSLVVSADATFDGTDARTAMTLETLGGVQYYTATVDFTSGQFFSFAAFITAPGGVLGSSLWLKADTGTNTTVNGSTITAWNDQSGNSRHVTQSNGNGSVLYNTVVGNTRFNFNPSLYFDTTTDALRSAAGVNIFNTNNQSATIFGVSDQDDFELLQVNHTSISAFGPGYAYDSPDIRSSGIFSYNNNISNSILLSPGNFGSNTTRISTISLIENAATSDQARFSYNGGVFSLSTGEYELGTDRFLIGGDGFTGGDNATSIGNVSEIIAYESQLSNVEMLRIQSYLSIKYGTTLNQAILQNYLASDGTTIYWNATTNTGYNNNIAGIARDDFSGLNQKQSQSVNTGIQPVIGNVNITDTNANNTNNFTADLSALVWGSDTGSTSFATSFVFGGLNNRMARIWRVQETGTVGNVKVAILASQITANVSSLNLVVSADATFDGTDTRTAMTLETLGGVQYYTATVDFTTGQFFTFASFVTAPGGVSGINLWYKADQGVTTSTGVSQWNNSAQNAYNLTQGTAANQPVYNTTTNIINFNPSMRFDGTNDNLQAANVPISEVASGSNPYASSHYIVYRGLSTTNGPLYVSATNTPSIWNVGSQTDGQVLITNRYISTSAVNVNETRLQAFDGTSNAASSYLNGLLMSSTLSASTGTSAANPFFSVGVTPGASNYANADIAEIVVYNTNQPVNRNRIESYLSLKYGITKSGDYQNSVSSIIWNATTNTGYNNNIAGIARDDASALNQKQSQSVNTGLQPVIGNVNIAATNAGNTNNFTADLSALVWGSDTGSTSFATSFIFGGLNNRMIRIWRVQETGTVGTVKIAIPASQVAGNISSLNLVTSADATFDGSDPRTAMTLETLGGVQYYTATVDFTSGQFFTFAAVATAPGGVLGTTSWFKSDADVTLNGSTVSAWKNQSANANLANLSQATASRQPSYSSNGWNFNPSITYDGNSDILESTFPSMLNVLNATNNEMFGALSVTGGSGARVYFQISDNGLINPRLSLENAIAHFPSTSGFITNTGLSQTSSLPSIINFSSGSGNLSYAINGNTPATGTFSGSITAGSVPRYMLGGYNSSGSYANFTSGNINEVITYDKTLTTTERQRVQSYLAVKYGQTLAHSYLNSSGTAIWDITTNTGYNNNITGIARDDFSGLNQKQSQSVNTGTQMVISNGNIAASNAANTNNFTADLSALVWGDNGLSLTYTTSVTNNIPSGLNFAYRMSRIWRVQETGTVGTTKVAMRSAAVANGENAYIIVSSSPTFASGNTWYPLTTTTTINGVAHYTADIDFTNGQYFTFAVKMIGPGGVPGSSLWVRADKAGTYSNNGTVNNWDDVSVNDNDVLQSTAANQPLYKDNINDNLNFNPVLSFDGTNDYMDATTFTINGSTNTLFSAVKPNVVNVTQDILGFGAVNSSSGGELRFNNAVLEYGQNNGTFVSIFSGSVLTAGTPLLFGSSMNNVANGTNLYYNNRTLTTGTIGQIPSAANLVSIGSRTLFPGRAFYFNGLIPEVAAFNSVLTATERQRVNSYLAIKYGMTLDQTSLTNYLASNAGIIWNATTNTGYNNNIAGIMRDDASGLTQKQSQSVNSGLQPVIGNVNIADTNANNTNNLSSDLSSLVWGSDTGSTSFATSFVFGGLTARMTRTWKVQETGAVGSVKVALPVSQVTGNISSLNLVVSADATFDGSDTRTAMTLETLGGVQYYTATVDFTTGQFFSFAAVATAPGGVFPALGVWLKADAGTSTTTNGSTLTSWTDQSSGSSFTNAAGTVLYQTSAGNSGFNFNPSLNFSTTSTALRSSNTLFPASPVSSATFFGVSNVNGSQLLSVNSNLETTAFSFYDYPSFSSNSLFARTNSSSGGLFAANNSLTGTISRISTGIMANGTSVTFSLNGGTATTVTGTYTTNTGAMTIGADTWSGGDDLTAVGNVPEVIAYIRQLTALEQLRVESYLAVKYGITKTGDYQNSAATVIWTNDASYQNNVFGILRDDVSALHQRISKSVNSGSVLTLSTDTNFTNANSTHAAIGTDLQSLVIGETTGAYTFTGTALTASGVTFSTTEAMAKRWKVQDTGGISCINLRFDATSLPALSGNERYYLIVSDDANFTSNVVYRAVTRTGNNIDVSVNFRDNNVSYFTLAKKDLGISGGDLTDVKSGISTIPSAAWKPTLPNTYLEINSNSKGLVVSRVASTAAIVNPIEGMIIYDLSDNTMKVYTGTIWRKLGDYSTGSNGNINIFCN